MKDIVLTFGIGGGGTSTRLDGGTIQNNTGCHPEEGSRKQVERRSFLIICDVAAWLLQLTVCCLLLLLGLPPELFVSGPAQLLDTSNHITLSGF